MNPCRNYLLSAVVFSLVICASSGMAEDGTLGDLGLRVRKERLDSYYLDHRIWEQYGYRPYATTQIRRFESSLPTYTAGKDYYSYGTMLPVPSAEKIGAASSKRSIQLTKYGTWH